jgi:hypothetical protein
MPKRRLTTYLGDCSFERLRALSDEDRRTLSDYVVGVLADHLRNLGKPGSNRARLRRNPGR